MKRDLGVPEHLGGYSVVQSRFLHSAAGVSIAYHLLPALRVGTRVLANAHRLRLGLKTRAGVEIRRRAPRRFVYRCGAHLEDTQRAWRSVVASHGALYVVAGRSGFWCTWKVRSRALAARRLRLGPQDTRGRGDPSSRYYGALYVVVRRSGFWCAWKRSTVGEFSYSGAWGSPATALLRRLWLHRIEGGGVSGSSVVIADNPGIVPRRVGFGGVHVPAGDRTQVEDSFVCLLSRQADDGPGTSKATFEIPGPHIFGDPRGSPQRKNIHSDW
ncbi:hypothetical protein C8J57DRAFT_1212746 [Mycena rebaudengoi]|nr:hypothetical protein C8J57DRAFT_1212746 [Mycena rebaudengoi]